MAFRLGSRGKCWHAAREFVTYFRGGSWSRLQTANHPRDQNTRKCQSFYFIVYIYLFFVRTYRWGHGPERSEPSIYLEGGVFEADAFSMRLMRRSSWRRCSKCFTQTDGHAASNSDRSVLHLITSSLLVSRHLK